MAKRNYDLQSTGRVRRFDAPALPYAPRGPRRYNPPIALIGCGGITEWHLKAYRKSGLNIAVLCDVNRDCADARRMAFYPTADVYTDYRDVLARDDVEVLDIATHANVRPDIVEASLRARKHVLSQKPFVLDLDRGLQLADLADEMGVKLAVNQNGRWAPHFAYMRHAIARGLIGEVMSAHLAVHWNHDWVAGTPFDALRHVVLYDFAIHWFDILTTLMGAREAKRVYASAERAPGQKAKPPLLGQVLIEYDSAQATLAFDGFTRFGALDETYVAGSKGSLRSSGRDLGKQMVTLETARGRGKPALRGSWFPDGFRGTMLELLRAVEEDRQPANNARDNLRGLALCFAACRSADTRLPQVPGDVRKMVVY